MTAGAPEDRRVGITWVEARTGVDRVTLWRWYRKEPVKFPRPHYLGARRMWWLSEVLAWEADQAAHQVAPAAPSAGGLG